jgi:hypothetical protein
MGFGVSGIEPSNCYLSKEVATLPLGDINTEVWSSGMVVGRGANNPTL